MTKFAVVVSFERDTVEEARQEHTWIEAVVTDNDFAGTVQHVTLHRDERPSVYPFPPFVLVES